ncbi:MAG: 2-oxoacid:acceptor oxidoreductase subunit alpha [Thermodesulfobacteriaceae bacterium]|nr:2-oxoacid:acceptor oxidoreductase subunit alpha [Thermodesulfobacteriaceae bacterium]MCX8041176.1 2-oxoacid:acceptor oxidoreductase subunit alpha [Thermodesulfobacteriaceae bacterium]MDW8135186.1 2-oxoacid:acceptor oxidoreductase subunit alpha [Thermodesulfobacterium sp.]
MDYSIKIGGEAGQGIQTIGDALAHIFTRAGFYVFSHQDYESRIRGGHNFYQIRISDRPITASRNRVHILVALDRESIFLHERELVEEGQVLYDSSLLRERFEKENFLDLPLLKLALEFGGDKIMVNTVAIGAIIGMLGMDPEIMFELIKKTFIKKGIDLVEANLKAAKAGYELARKECLRCSFRLSEFTEPKMLISGNEAIGLGAIASGVKFYSAYPMTPSTGIFNFIAEQAKDFDIVVEQAEDEISAINMIIGASFAGVRAMTGTSGGGFALMVEGLSLAGMTETPIVVALAQRPGPATGLPTRTEAADLLFALYAGHGEFPKILFAPGNPEQAFYLTNKAFDLAEKFQVPAIILTDQYLADSQWSYQSFDLTKLKYVDYRLRGDSLKNLSGYKRHAFTDTGVSPLGIPGDSSHLIITDSDEHDEEGHLIEDAEIRVKMVQKRLFQKIPLLKKEIEPPTLYGEKKPDLLLICWGSLYGIVKEVVDELSKDFKVAMLHFSEIFPFSEEVSWVNLIKEAKIVINIEQNATSQFAKLLQLETGVRIKKHINRFDGRPFTVDELKERVNYAYLERF